MASWQEHLNKFNKQQERCLLSIGGIKSDSKSTPKITPCSTPANSKSPVPAVKFSDDTERLQRSYFIKKGSIGTQIKLVIDLLQKTRQALTPEQIKEECYVDVKDNKAVFDSLKDNLKVYYDGSRFSYKSKHDVKDKNQLLHLIQRFPEGIAVVDLKDAYPTVMDDLQSLKDAREIWLLPNFDPKEDTAYPNDPKVQIMIDDDLKQLFRGVELPSDMKDIEKDLQKNGLKPATNTEKRRAMAQVHGIYPKPKQKKKNREISRRTKLTNAHLLDLFPNLMA